MTHRGSTTNKRHKRVTRKQNDWNWVHPKNFTTHELSDWRDEQGGFNIEWYDIYPYDYWPLDEGIIMIPEDDWYLGDTIWFHPTFTFVDSKGMRWVPRPDWDLHIWG